MTDKTGYDKYLEIKDKVRKKHEARARHVNREDTPQHILWTKSVCDMLEDKHAKCTELHGKFYFTEQLVNKLMHLSYLDGCSEIDKRSFEEGWAAREVALRKKLDLL